MRNTTSNPSTHGYGTTPVGCRGGSRFVDGFMFYGFMDAADLWMQRTCGSVEDAKDGRRYVDGGYHDVKTESAIN